MDVPHSPVNIKGHQGGAGLVILTRFLQANQKAETCPMSTGRPQAHGGAVPHQSRTSLICRIGMTLVKLGMSPLKTGAASAIPSSYASILSK